MTQKQNEFITLWQECYDAAYYVLRTKKVAGFLHDAATMEKEIHRQVWDERFGNAMVRHPASVFLDELQAESLETSIHIRSRMRSFRPRIGMNLPLFKLILGADAVLMILLFILPRLLFFKKLKWMLILFLGVALLGGAAIAVKMLMQSLHAPVALKKAFDEEKKMILALLETAR